MQGNIEDLIRQLAKQAAKPKLGEQESPDIVDDSVRSELPELAPDPEVEPGPSDEEVKERKMRELASLKSQMDSSLNMQDEGMDTIGRPTPNMNPVPKDEELEGKLKALQDIVGRMR